MEMRQENLCDLPVIAHFIKESGIAASLDRHFMVHGNWSAPSLGNLVSCFLLYMISECDHRLYAVEDWADLHKGFLGQFLGIEPFEGRFLHDDRLGLILEHLSDMERFGSFMSDYSRDLIRLYKLPAQTVRVDSFNVPSYREPDVEGLFRRGYTKSHQVDEPQMKVMVAALDPLALPVASFCAAGSVCDDDLYLPVISKARCSIGSGGVLYVGDTKMGSAAVRSDLVLAGDFYLCPLSAASLAKGEHEAIIKACKEAPQESLELLYKQLPKGHQQLTDRVFELPCKSCRHKDETGGEWEERRIMVFSLSYAESQEKSLRQKIEKARQEVEIRFFPRKNAQKWYQGQEDKANAFIQNVVKKYGVADYLHIELVPNQDASPKTKGLKTLGVTTQIKEQAVTEKIQNMGWRLYVTNIPGQRMGARQILVCYRNEYLIEHQFHKMLSKTTALLPINLKKDNRCAALVNLVILAMQFVSIIQHTARTELAKTEDAITDVVPGNKSKKVYRPTAELLLSRLKGITCVRVTLPDNTKVVQVLNFHPTHLKILRILRCPDDLYSTYANYCF